MDKKQQTPGVVSLERADIKRAADVFKRSFTNDPMINYIYPVNEMSDKLSSSFFGGTVRYYFEYGLTIKTCDMDGLSIWIPPGKLKLNAWGIIKSRLFVIPIRLGRAGFKRQNILMDLTKKLHIKYAGCPHYYLMVLAVDPAHQSKGLGSALMRPVLQKADEEGMPCYLEASNERAVPLYQRHGFKVMEEAQIPDGPVFWPMRREPLK